MLNALTPRTAGHLQLGAGVFLRGLELPPDVTAETLRERVTHALEDDAMTFGLTTGGGEFRCVPMLRSPAEEARRAPLIDGVLLDGWVVTLSGTMAELTPDNLASAMPGARLERHGRVTELRLRTDAVEPLPALCWVGDTGAGLVLIELTDAVNTSGAVFRFVERGEGRLPFQFRAHQRLPGDEYAPCRVLLLEEA